MAQSCWLHTQVCAIGKYSGDAAPIHATWIWYTRDLFVSAKVFCKIDQLLGLKVDGAKTVVRSSTWSVFPD